jgi:long-chain acyl-CoA synthetase
MLPGWGLRKRAKMTNSPWLAHYPSEVPQQLPPVPFANLPELLRSAAGQYEKTTAFTQVMPNGMNGSLTYAQVDLLSDHFASYLREELGLAAGDRVAVQMPNCLSYPIVAFGIFKAGCVLVNTNPLYTPNEMIHQFSDSGATTLVIIDMFAGRLPEVMGHTNIKNVVTVKISQYFPPIVGGIVRLVQKFWSRSLPKIEVKHTKFSSALSKGKAKYSKETVASYSAGLTSDSLAALQYTGGTTGVSKGAMLSHGNLVSNTLQMIAHCGTGMRAGKEIVLTALPLYHIFAFTVNLLGFYYNGARNILVPSPRPPSNLRRAFDNYKITWLSGVNTLFNALLNERWFQDAPPKHLHASAAGGMSLQASVAERWRELTGTPIVEGFGLTESSPVLTFNPLTGLSKDGTTGIPVPSTEIKCVDANGNQVPVGEPGEVIARGPQIMLGYWQRPEETAKTLKDGWLHTGDVATMDADGYLTIVDRTHDMIIVSGFNVYPNEIEEQIAAVPGVLEVGVIGVPDEKSGERVRAYIKATVPAPSKEDIIAHCRANLAAYKIPQDVVFVEDLPKSPIGKILRRTLRDEAIGKSSNNDANKGA